MRIFIILIGLAEYVDLGEASSQNKDHRLAAIYDLVFSFGPAWHGNQSSILLQSSLGREDIIQRISPLVGAGDLVGVMEIALQSVTTIGWVADEEGLDDLFPKVAKISGLAAKISD